jgi:iron complex transport system ATP-binding protein
MMKEDDRTEDRGEDRSVPLCVEGVSHSFNGLKVLDSVDLTLSPGEVTAVVGPNAAGKTTLVRAAAGLLDPDEGEVALSGELISALSRREIARRLSLIRQAPPQAFDYSALELVLMGFHARSGRFSMPSERQRTRAREAMATLGIEELADRPASVLSGGELQRALMARTMVADTTVWLLDEPTAHLDVRHQVDLMEQVRRHVEQDGGAAMAVLHDLTLAERYCERAAVLHEGRLVACGPTDKTLTEQRLSEVFGVELVHGMVDGSPVWAVGR